MMLRYNMVIKRWQPQEQHQQQTVSKHERQYSISSTVYALAVSRYIMLSSYLQYYSSSYIHAADCCWSCRRVHWPVQQPAAKRQVIVCTSKYILECMIRKQCATAIYHVAPDCDIPTGCGVWGPSSGLSTGVVLMCGHACSYVKRNIKTDVEHWELRRI